MRMDDSVINHTLQRETSHSRVNSRRGKFLTMDESETFRQNLRAVLERTGLKKATVARMAGVNARGVTDILEGRSESPKLSTVFKIAQALGEDPGEMLGLGPRPKIQADLAAFLARYDETDQQRFLSALRLFEGRGEKPTALPPPQDK